VYRDLPGELSAGYRTVTARWRLIGLGVEHAEKTNVGLVQSVAVALSILVLLGLANRGQRPRQRSRTPSSRKSS